MTINIELTEKELRELVHDRICTLCGELPIKVEDIQIQVKSKQNYKSEWESAAFRAVVNKLSV